MPKETVLARAKLNLTLDVTGILPDGYHSLDMIMQAITLYERVIVRKSQEYGGQNSSKRQLEKVVPDKLCS